jgi:hypothetical protein
MYNFEVKVKVLFLYEITYEEIVKEFDQREGAYERKVIKTERFIEWSELRSFAYELKNKKILQVTEIKDVTSALRNDMTTQGKD